MIMLEVVLVAAGYSFVVYLIGLGIVWIWEAK